MLHRLLALFQQRTLEIWGFAIQFGFKYFLLNQKWTYKKEEGGMSKEAVSARKKVGTMHVAYVQGFTAKCDFRSRKDGKALRSQMASRAMWDVCCLQHVLTPSSLTGPPLPMLPPSQELAVWLREELVKLGPTFIKV